MYVRARRRACYGMAESDEGNAGALQISHQRLPFGAVGVHGYVHGVAVINPSRLCVAV